MNYLKQAVIGMGLLSTILIVTSCKDDSPVSDDPQEEEVTISFQATQTVVTEDNDNIIQIPLKIEGVIDKEVFVTYEVSGTASFPGDVTPLTSSTFIIPAGASAFNLEMMALEDAERELQDESLFIKFISISEGGKLGQNTTHELVISGEEVVLVSFEQVESCWRMNDNPSIKVQLSEAYDKDIKIGISVDDIYSLATYYVYTDYDEYVTIPAGQTEGYAKLYYDLAKGYSSSGAMVTVSFWSFKDGSGSNLTDVIEDTVVYKTEHVVNLVDLKTDLGVKMLWESSNSDVDMDLALRNSNGEVVVSEANTEVESYELMNLTSELPDGEYEVLFNYYSGSGDVDLYLILMPVSESKLNGSSSGSLNGYLIDKPDQMPATYTVGVLTKTGNNYSW